VYLHHTRQQNRTNNHMQARCTPLRLAAVLPQAVKVRLSLACARASPRLLPHRACTPSPLTVALTGRKVPAFCGLEQPWHRFLQLPHYPRRITSVVRQSLERAACGENSSALRYERGVDLKPKDKLC
jgi:hypothetical protein